MSELYNADDMFRYAAGISGVGTPEQELLIAAYKVQYAAQCRAIFVYEAARVQAACMHSPIVPEPWLQRDPAFCRQFVATVEMMCGDFRQTDPVKLHDDWVEAYKKMGWKYGAVRDVEAKTHPDMVPYDDLGPLEKAKDEVFVALCEIARQWTPPPS